MVGNKLAILQFATALKHFKAVGVLNDAPITNPELFESSSPNVKAIRLNQFPLPPAECSYDMHTTQSRGRGKMQFRTEGSAVNNVDPRFNDPVLKELYEKSLL